MRDRHRTEIKVGNRVQICAYGLGATVHDCGKVVTVLGFARTRVKVRIPGRTVGPEVVNIDPGSLLVAP